MARWDPWSDLFNLQNEMSRWVNEVFGGSAGLAPTTGRLTAGVAPMAHLPLDIRQTDKEFILEASVPGFTPEEVEVTADQGVLTVRGEHKLDQSEKEGTYLRRERGQYSFMRQLTLPADVKEGEITATFTNGVLKVHLPRVETVPPRRIPVSALETETKTIEAGSKS